MCRKSGDWVGIKLVSSSIDLFKNKNHVLTYIPMELDKALIVMPTLTDHI